MASLKQIIVTVLIISFTSTLFASQKTNNGNGHNELNQVITELADKLFIYNKLTSNNEEIALTSFVDLHQLNKTTHFGRTLSEAFFDELFTRGFNVSDFRGQETLSVNANGEYFLTRDINLLNKDVTSAYVLVGTYSLFEGKVHVNARILDNQSGKVLASARSNYLTDNCELLETCKEARKIKIITDGCSTINCPKKSNRININAVSYKNTAHSIPNTVTYNQYSSNLIKKREHLKNHSKNLNNNLHRSDKSTNNYKISLIK